MVARDISWHSGYLQGSPSFSQCASKAVFLELREVARGWGFPVPSDSSILHITTDCLWIQVMSWTLRACFPLCFLSGAPSWPPRDFAVSVSLWVDSLVSFLKFKFRTTIGSHFWDLLQEVLQQVLESLSIPENPQERQKNPPFTENENN